MNFVQQKSETKETLICFISAYYVNDTSMTQIFRIAIKTHSHAYLI